MNLKHLAGFAAALSLGIAPVAGAQTDGTDNTLTSNVGSISSYTALFKSLDGMTVSWTTSNGCPTADCTGTWGHIGGSTWGVISNSHSNFSLTANGNLDTYGIGAFGYNWDLTGKNITGFSMDATTADAVFDILAFPDGTPGSSLGNEFGECKTFIFVFCVQGDQWNTVATYSDEIGVGGNAPVGDLYGLLDVSFGKKFGSSDHSASVAFTQDMDLTSGDFSIPQEATPEPGVMTMMATGLVGLAGLARRRRKR
jgi:MYXO-CTERM domain-containing protein